METLIIRNVEIIGPERVLPPSSVICAHGTIIDILPGETHSPAHSEVDARGCYLAPGFIDLHTHGTHGLLANNGPDALAELSRILPSCGVTAFLPGLTPSADDELLLHKLAKARADGAKIPAFLLEGHFLKLAGAITGIRPDYSKERAERLLAAAAPFPLVFALSPEIGSLEELLPIMTAGGLPAFITHTGAGAEDTEHAIALGATHATHFANVFPYGGDKEPGVRGCGAMEAILASPDTSVDFILDGEHVDPCLIKIALACRGKNKVCLITDANTNAGLPPGTYQGIGGRDVVVAYEGGPARLGPACEGAGSLAGSGLTMERAVRNAVSMLDLPLPLAVKMASANPAAVLGVDNRKGTIKAGYDADFSLLDHDLQVQACYVGGILKYQRCSAYR